MEQVITTTVELSQALAQSVDKSNPPADENTEQSQNIDSVSTSANTALYKALLEAVANDDTEALTIVLNIETSAEIGLSATEFKKLENSLEEFDFDTASEVLRGSSLATKT
jgi:HAMP domain-containing protein